MEIRRDEFVKGSEENDWAGCFQEWADQIEGFIGAENKEILVSFFFLNKKACFFFQKPPFV